MAITFLLLQQIVLFFNCPYRLILLVSRFSFDAISLQTFSYKVLTKYLDYRFPPSWSVSLGYTLVYIAPVILSLCHVSLPYCPVIEEQNGVWLRNKPQQYSFHDTTTSIRHLVAQLFHKNSCPTTSENHLILKYSQLQNLRTLEKHTIALKRAVWEFYVICVADIQLKLAGSSSATHALERYTGLTQTGHAAILFAPNEFQDIYNDICPVHLLLYIRISHFWLWPHPKK